MVLDLAAMYHPINGWCDLIFQRMLLVYAGKESTVHAEDLLLEFMARVNNALSLEDDALRLRAVRQAKHWAEEEYERLQPLPVIEVAPCE